VLLKTFTQFIGARKGQFAPNTPLIRYARKAQDRCQRSPLPWHRLSFKFGVFICDRNSNTC